MSSLAYTPCRCGCRPPDAEEPCDCPECRPGPGLDHQAKRKESTRRLETRLTVLLHRRLLTDAETAELDSLLDWYVHGGSSA